MKLEQKVYIADGINIVAGLWLVAAPFMMAYTGTIGGTNDIILGLVIAIVAAVRIFYPLTTPRLDWVNVVLAAWLIVSAYVMPGRTSAMAWNNVILGILVIAMSYWSTHSITRGKSI